MSKRLVPILTILAVFCIAGPTPARQGSADESGWISLFDGKSLAGWRIVNIDMAKLQSS